MHFNPTLHFTTVLSPKLVLNSLSFPISVEARILIKIALI